MTLPRRTIRLRGAGFRPEEEDEVRECLAIGRSVLGEPAVYGLKTRFDWSRAWEQFGAELLKEHAEKWPGSRPMAMYVLGLLPCQLPEPKERAIWTEFEVENNEGAKVFFPFRFNATSTGCESSRLLKAGVIDKSEHRRHVAGPYHKTYCGKG